MLLLAPTLALDGNSTRRLQMQRRLIWVTLFSVAIAVTALYHTRKVHATSNNGQHGVCSKASLKGKYAYLVSGPNKSLGGLNSEMGIDDFNGDGKRGVIRATGISFDGGYDWTDAPWPSVSYTVDPDCTGSIFTADGTKAGNIIVLDGGKRFSLLSAPLETNKVITGEGTLLEEKKD
jgi:hypothetical protein